MKENKENFDELLNKEFEKLSKKMIPFFKIKNLDDFGYNFNLFLEFFEKIEDNKKLLRLYMGKNLCNEYHFNKKYSSIEEIPKEEYKKFKKHMKCEIDDFVKSYSYKEDEENEEVEFIYYYLYCKLLNVCSCKFKKLFITNSYKWKLFFNYFIDKFIFDCENYSLDYCCFYDDYDLDYYCICDELENFGYDYKEIKNKSFMIIKRLKLESLEFFINWLSIDK